LPFSYYFNVGKNTSIKWIHGDLSALEAIYDRNSKVWFVARPTSRIADVIDWVDRNSLWAKKFSGGLRVYFISQRPPTQFKASIFTNLALSQSYISFWETTLASVGVSATVFNDATNLLSVNMSEFDIIAFVDIKRSLNDTERLYLEESLRNGLTVIVSGLSPYWLAGGTTDLTPISTWFGANIFSEAPREEKWKIRFTSDATSIREDVDLNREYSFYTDLDWSTPTATLNQYESVVYAYRVNDGGATIFSHEFGNGSLIFNGVRYGFWSPDAEIFQRFLQAVIQSVIG